MEDFDSELRFLAAEKGTTSLEKSLGRAMQKKGLMDPTVAPEELRRAHLLAPADEVAEALRQEILQRHRSANRPWLQLESDEINDLNRFLWGHGEDLLPTDIPLNKVEEWRILRRALREVEGSGAFQVDPQDLRVLGQPEAPLRTTDWLMKQGLSPFSTGSWRRRGTEDLW